MTIDAALIPIDPEVDRRLKLWLAAPEVDKIMECVQAEGRLKIAELTNDIVHSDLNPKAALDQQERLNELRRLRDFVSTLQDLRRRTEPFSTLHFK